MLLTLCAVGLAPARPAVAAEKRSQEQLEFFESRIRPVLIAQCYECHNSAESAEGGFAADTRRRIRDGGAGGAAIQPGNPDDSRLMAILRHEVDGLEMPQGGAKLSAEVLADFERWIAMGAPDPRDTPPSAEELATANSWEASFQRRQEWWSFQPIERAEPPQVDDPRWQTHPIDRFVEHQRQAAGIQAVEPADPAILVRRLYIHLLGLPPGRREATQWIERIEAAEGPEHDRVVAELVDQLLGRPQFGERWSRHWMDWIRYAESHGSEGDPRIENAWQYRDYLIRALNADVPYDQLVREHVAGDLLQSPRINDRLGINESAIGPAHWRMVFHGFAPTDALDEKVRFTDDAINTFSKAFLGLTVSCARCHNHKFDAISQADYYALFGILASCRPARTVIDAPQRIERNRQALKDLKPEIRDAIAGDWIDSLDGLTQRVTDALSQSANQTDGRHSLLAPLRTNSAQAATGAVFADAWQQQADAVLRSQEQQESAADALKHWDLSRPSDYADWYPAGTGLPPSPRAAGEFAVATEGDQALRGIYPSGVYSNGLSAKDAARLTSPDVALTQDAELWVRALGDRQASLRYVVQDYPRSGTVYPVTKLQDRWQWHRFDLSYWTEDTIHIELAAARDAPLLTSAADRSWFGIREAKIVAKGQADPRESVEHLQPIFAAAAGSPPQTQKEALLAYQTAIGSAIRAWRDGTATDAQACLLDACLRQGLLPNRLDHLPSARPLVSRYRELESEVPVPTRVVGLEESTGRDHPLLVRGNHKTPGELVPRRFLEAVDPTPYQSPLSGRRQLAEDLLREDNPFTRRVIVNRVWHHLFGRGIVDTPDNLGRLGSQPTHPQLLDWLAHRFVADGWSLKSLIRRIVTSRTWQLASEPSAAAKRVDPQNRWLTHANVRRMEAEAIRDSMLAVSGLLDPSLHGESVGGESNRRSVYVQVLRNSIDPFLRTFDFPEPFSTVGRRDATNVPAQSLTLMNDPRIDRYATAWARRLRNDASLQTDRERIAQMLWTAFGRSPTETELHRIEQYLKGSRRFLRDQQRRRRELRQRIDRLTNRIDALADPVRRQLKADRDDPVESQNDARPQPLACWDFEDDTDDRLGSLHGRLVGKATLKDGAVVVGRGGHVLTERLSQPLTEKTLEAWVQLDTLDQRGGGVMTVQSRNGRFFDSIVFGEKDPRQWLAGSNNFARTESFEAPAETAAVDDPVHLAVVYRSNGEIAAYRNGQPYGSAYRSSGPYRFEAGETILSFGVRHLPAGGNRLLSGRIFEARLYDRALTEAEIATSAGSMRGFISDDQVLAAMSAEDRSQVTGWRDEIETLKQQLAALGPQPSTDGSAVWADVTRLCFLMKEFIYVR